MDFMTMNAGFESTALIGWAGQHVIPLLSLGASRGKILAWSSSPYAIFTKEIFKSQILISQDYHERYLKYHIFNKRDIEKQGLYQYERGPRRLLYNVYDKL